MSEHRDRVVEPPRRGGRPEPVIIAWMSAAGSIASSGIALALKLDALRQELAHVLAGDPLDDLVDVPKLVGDRVDEAGERQGEAGGVDHDHAAGPEGPERTGGLRLGLLPPGRTSCVGSNATLKACERSRS